MSRLDSEVIANDQTCVNSKKIILLQKQKNISNSNLCWQLSQIKAPIHRHAFFLEEVGKTFYVF